MAIVIHETPSVSVIIPTFNSHLYLADAVNSILSQTFSNFELITIDDESGDGSADIIRSLAATEPRIRPFFIQHGGIARAMNRGIAEARGNYISYLDHDDLALPNRLESQLAWMQKHDLDICGSCFKRIGDNSNLMWFPESNLAICHEMLFSCSLLQTGVMLRTDIAKENPYREDVTFLDYELWTRLAGRYRMGNIQQILTLYRSHPQQTSILKSEEFRQDLRRYREPLFYRLFPDATQDDYSAFTHLADKEPMKSVDMLKCAGDLLVRLTSSGDRFLIDKMARRWWDTCYRNAPLGFECYPAYKSALAKFGLTC